METLFKKHRLLISQVCTDIVRESMNSIAWEKQLVAIRGSRGVGKTTSVGKLASIYKNKGILKVDPFEVLDQEGVGQLVEMACRKGRATKPELNLGICGEHGGEPSSVKFCASLGMNYVSCSPYRVPIARLAAAQAAVEE